MTAPSSRVSMVRRRRLAAGVLAASTLLAGLGASGTEAGSTAPSQTGGPSADDLPVGVTELIDCIARNQYLTAVVLVDESGSLKKTDPEARRVEFSRSLAAALRQISTVRIDDVATTLDVLVLGFSTDVRNAELDPPTPQDWVTVSGPDTYRNVEAAIDTFRDRNLGLDTDYVTALQTAQELLLRRGQEVPAGTSPCSAILWFTDGKFDISPSDIRRPWAQDIELDDLGSDAAVDRGVELLCASGGIADRLRASNTFLLTFALLSPSFEGADELLLRRVTLGEADCGDIDASELGAYFPGTAPDDLVDCFYLALQGRGCSPPPPPPDAPCTLEAGCPVDFVVDDSTVSVRVEIFAQPSTETVTITPPGGATIPIRQLTADAVPGTTLTTTSSNRAGFVTLAIDGGSSGALGTWRIDHRPPQGGTLEVDVSVTPNYRLTIGTDPEVNRGESFDVEVAIVGSSGRPIDPITIDDSARVVVETVDGGEIVEHVAERVGGSAVFIARITAPADGSAPTIDIRAEAEFRGADGSLRELATPTVSIDAILTGYPTVESALSIGGLEAAREPDRRDDGTQPVLPLTAPAGSIAVSAPRDVGGTVCVESTDMGVGAATQKLEPDQKCVELEPGATGQITFTFRDAAPTAGAINGTVRLELTSKSDDTTRTVEVPVEGSIVVPPPDPYSDAGRAWWFFFIGLLVPLLVYFARAAQASQFEKPTLVSVRTQQANLDLDGMRVVASGGGPLDGFEYLSQGSSPRHAAGGTLTFEAPASMFRLPTATVSSGSDSALVVTSHDPSRVHRGKAPIGHQLQGQWVFVAHSLDGSRVNGTFSTLVQDPEGGGSLITRLQSNASAELARQHSEIVEKFNSTSRGSSPDDLVDVGPKPPGSTGDNVW